MSGAEAAGRTDPREPGAVVERPPACGGLAARGAVVEAGGPEFHFRLDSKAEVWAEGVPRLYQQALAAQWNPATAVEWDAPFELPEEVESAVVQVMTYLVENETAALLVPARFLAQVHTHFREVMQLLAVQVADEARHVAFGVGHLQYAVALDPGLRGRLAAAAGRRHDALAQTSGLNEEVFDALVLLAAGGRETQALAAGFEKVQALKREMAADRTSRLVKLGFDPDEARALSELHTRNFM